MPAGLLRLAARTAPADGPVDALLLDRFVTAGDATAFAVLVARHGPTVLGVCRRVLGNAPDADDAFQATFLVLVRRAAAVRDRDRLAGWLYGVAYRTALEARTLRARRWRRETPTDVPPDAPAPAGRDPELAAVIDAELGRLPEKYRTAIVLCDLDGRPRAEAARSLGVSEGTLSSRLAEGRKRLADRLARRGLALTGLGATVVPAPLAEAAVRTAAGGGSPFIHDIAKGVTRAMNASKLKVWALAAVPAALVAAVLAGGPPATAALVPPLPATIPVVAALAADDKKSVADAPPVVVKTVPQAGADDVDPDLKEIRITFSKEMTDQSWSFATATEYGADPDLPDGAKITYDKDKKTCVQPVKLEPGKTYAMWLNSEKFGNFKDNDGRSAVPYLLVFQTKKK
jgi:RNA polymerase sigma factor (sigma-70 family)